MELEQTYHPIDNGIPWGGIILCSIAVVGIGYIGYNAYQDYQKTKTHTNERK